MSPAPFLPAPFFRAFRVARELLGAVLSLGVIIWGLSSGVAVAILAASGHLDQVQELARSHFVLCMIVGAFAEIGGRLITWPLTYEIRTLEAERDR